MESEKMEIKLEQLTYEPYVPQRFFEVAKGWEDKEINLPKRATKNAAGYDFEAAEDVLIPSLIRIASDLECAITGIRVPRSSSIEVMERYIEKAKTFLSKNELTTHLKPVLVPTGVKACMGSNEQLVLANRSGNPLKQGLLLANGVGVIDADYYGNASNDGHIMFQFWNFGAHDIIIKKGDRIGQGIFMPFLTVTRGEDTFGDERIGGFGSSGK